MDRGIGLVDSLVLIVYLAGVVAVGCWAGIRMRRKSHDQAGYFLAGRQLTWPMIGLALFSTNISTIHLVGFAQEGYMNGLVAGNFEWLAAFLLVTLSLFFAPFYIRSKVATLPDFLERRYGPACRDWLAVLSVISAVFIHIGFTLYTGAVVLKGLFGIPIMYSVIGASVLTGIYTIVGGLTAVVVTESIQAILLIGGSALLTVIAYSKVGGWDGISLNVDAVKLTMLRPADDPAGLPWYAMILGYPVIGLWYWCADQTIVQRVLGARDENHARIGPLFAGFLKILPVFIFVLPGVILLALVNQGQVGELQNSEDAFAALITHVLPAGLTGLMAAALLAALMSTVSGALNSIATLISYDLVKRWKPETTDETLVFVGRVATFVGAVLAILWTPFISHYEGIYQGSNTLISHIAPPITAVFVLGVFWRGASYTGAMATLVGGSLLGLVAFILDWFKDETGWNVPFMLTAFYLWVICMLIHVVVSLMRPQKLTTDLDQLCWKSPLEPLRDQKWRGLKDYRAISALLICTMVALYYVFA